MDAASLIDIRKFNPNVLVPLGDKTMVLQAIVCPVYEFEWWQEYEFFSPKDTRFNFYFLPAYHWSQRALFDRNRSLWGSWLIEYNNIVFILAVIRPIGIILNNRTRFPFN